MRHSGGVSEQKRVAVLAGGWSSEREVSKVSGAAVADALRTRGIEVLVIDPVNDLVRFAAQLVSARPDLIFNALHGTGGEDGVIQGALDMFGVPYTHSGIAACALAMDKSATKKIVSFYEIQTAQEFKSRRDGATEKHELELPYVIKPVADGSSVGVTIIRNDADLEKARTAGLSHQMVIAEKYIAGDELTCAVLEIDGVPQALGVTKLQASGEFYDYTAKYTDGVTTHLVNPDLPDGLTEKIKEQAVCAHRALGCSGVSRSDFRYNPIDGLVFLELNTHPGMTNLSLLPEQAAAKGIDFQTLIVTIMNAAQRRFDESGS